MFGPRAQLRSAALMALMRYAVAGGIRPYLHRVSFAPVTHRPENPFGLKRPPHRVIA